MFADHGIKHLLYGGYSVRIKWDTEYRIPDTEYQIRPQHENDWLDNGYLYDRLVDYLFAHGWRSGR